MATVIGESGAWKDVLSLARSCGLTLADPPDVGRQRTQTQHKLQQQLAQVEDDLAKQETALIQPLAETKLQSERGPAEEARQLQLDIASLRARLTSTESKSRSWLAQLWVRLSVWYETAQRRSQQRACIEELARRVTAAERALNELAKNRQLEVNRRIADTKQATEVLQEIADSSELRGAIAERAVIKEPGRLPDEYVLMNDVRLEYDRYIHFDDDHLKTAQLDHVLIGLTGVYVVETKNWSQHFVANGEYFSPFKQVKRASYLCYRIPKEAGCPCRVRSVVTFAGAIPSKPLDCRIAAVPVARLASYVQYGERAIPTGQIDLIRRVLF